MILLNVWQTVHNFSTRKTEVQESPLQRQESKPAPLFIPGRTPHRMIFYVLVLLLGQGKQNSNPPCSCTWTEAASRVRTETETEQTAQGAPSFRPIGCENGRGHRAAQEPAHGHGHCTAYPKDGVGTSQQDKRDPSLCPSQPIGSVSWLLHSGSGVQQVNIYLSPGHLG